MSYSNLMGRVAVRRARLEARMLTRASLLMPSKLGRRMDTLMMRRM